MSRRDLKEEKEEKEVAFQNIFTIHKLFIQLSPLRTKNENNIIISPLLLLPLPLIIGDEERRRTSTSFCCMSASQSA